MGELADLDMQRAPVAMTPFCTADANEATRGFRFWEAGFWKSALGERPYHISALFVVDLARFRKQAAGDTYRTTYHSLTADPSSLSNLDQDLPNYLQHEVHTRSLLEEGLYSYCAYCAYGAHCADCAYYYAY